MENRIAAGSMKSSMYKMKKMKSPVTLGFCFMLRDFGVSVWGDYRPVPFPRVFMRDNIHITAAGRAPCSVMPTHRERQGEPITALC